MSADVIRLQDQSRHFAYPSNPEDEERRSRAPRSWPRKPPHIGAMSLLFAMCAWTLGAYVLAIYAVGHLVGWWA